MATSDGILANALRLDSYTLQIASHLARLLRDRKELLQLVHQQLQSKIWTESAMDLLLENTLRFLITDNPTKTYTDFDFINTVGLTRPHQRLIEKYGQHIPYFFDCDESENLTEAVVVRLVGICVHEKTPSVAREQAVATLARGL